MKFKINILLLFSFISITVFAHEDTFEAFELSNLHIKTCVGLKSSQTISSVSSYAKVINDFIQEIDSTQKVFLQFSENYSFKRYLDFVFVSHGKFEDFLVPKGFPFGYKYDMKFIKKESGLNIIISANFFKLKPVLQLIEFGLSNRNYLVDNNIYDGQGCKSDTEISIDSILNSETSDIVKKYISKKITYQRNFLKDLNIDVFLINDSISFCTEGNEIVRIPDLYFVRYEESTGALFLFDNKSFYFINKSLESDNKSRNLSYKLGALEFVNVTYESELSAYKLTKTGIWDFQQYDDKYDLFYENENNNPLNNIDFEQIEFDFHLK